MTRSRRTVDRKLDLESLDSRVVPSAMGVPHGPALHAAVAFRPAMPANHSIYAANNFAYATNRFAVTPPRSAFAMRPTPNVFSAARRPTPNVFSAARTPIGYHAVVVPRPATPTFTVQVPKAVVNPTPNNPIRPTVVTTTTHASTTTDVGDIQNGPLAKAGQQLIALYQQFQQNGSVTPAQARLLMISGSSVGVDIRVSGDVNTASTQLTGMGMKVSAVDPSTHTVEGLLPINQLLNVAQLSNTVSITPIFRPMLL
jgi:hypothetical protein